MDTAQLNGHKRAVIYCRVSTKEQKDSGTSLDKQMEACRKYAESHGFVIVGDRYFDPRQKKAVSEPNEGTFPVPVYVDDFTGTVLIEQRPEGSKAYAMLERKEAEALVVFSVDRLCRPKEEGDEIDVPWLVRALKRIGCEVHTVGKGRIEVSTIGFFTAYLEGMAAGDERRKILQRMSDGKRDKARRLNKWVGSTAAPFGYTKVGKGKEARLEINPLEVDLVRRIFDLYLGLNGETAIGMDNLALLFNAEGIPVTGRNRRKPPHQRANYTWSASSMKQILSNRAYIGEFRWAGEVVTIPDLAIIDRETFDAAQAQKAINRSNAKRNVKYNYLLQGRITCTCARKMTAINYPRDGKVYLYYRCNRKAYDAIPECESRMILAELADRVAWNWLVDVFRNPEKLLTGLREYQARQRKKAEPNRKRLAELPGLIADCAQQAKGLTVSLAAKNPDDPNQALAIKVLEDSLAQVSAAHKRYTSEREKIEAELAAVEVTESDIQQILEWAAEIREAIDVDAFSFEAKQRVFERLNVTAQIEYQNEQRGLRLDCPVLTYASKWRTLSEIDYSRSLTAECNYSISGWVSLAEEFFGEAVKVA